MQKKRQNKIQSMYSTFIVLLAGISYSALNLNMPKFEKFSISRIFAPKNYIFVPLKFLAALDLETLCKNY